MASHVVNFLTTQDTHSANSRIFDFGRETKIKTAITNIRDRKSHLLQTYRLNTCQIKKWKLISLKTRGPNGKQLAVFFLPPMVDWVVDRHHRHVGCCPDARLKDTPLQMLIQSIFGWRNSLHVPKSSVRTTSFGRGQPHSDEVTSFRRGQHHSDEVNIIVLIWFIQVQPRDKICSHFF